MKTFIVLFVIAASLPADAQRVRENIRQRTVISGSSPSIAQENDREVKVKGQKKDSSETIDAKRKR